MKDSRFMVWARLMAAIIVLPLLILLAGAWYMASLNSELRFRTFATAAGEKLETMRLVAETEKYLCNGINDIYERSKSEDELKKGIESLAQEHDLSVRFVVWHKTGAIFSANFDYQASGGDWETAYLNIYKFFARTFKGGEKNILPDVSKNLREVFGPHFFPRYYRVCYSGQNIRFIRPDASRQKPLTWLKVDERFGLAVLLDYSVLEAAPGLKRMVDNDRDELLSGYVENGKIICRDSNLALKLRDKSDDLQRSLQNHLEIAGHYLFTNFINGKRTGFCAVNKSLISGFKISPLMWFVILALGSWLLAFAIFSFRVMVQQQQMALGIRRQLLLLFIVANALPGFILLVIGSDYLQQLKSSLLNNMYNRGMAYLQSIDELYSNEFTVQKARLEKSFPKLQEALRQNIVNRQSIMGFIDQQTPTPYRFFLVASNTGIVAGNKGILKNGKVKESFKKDFKNDDTYINAMDAMFKVCSYVLANLNKTPVSSKIGTEVEFISESLMQLSPAEVTQQFSQRGTFWNWSIGMKKHPTYIDIFQLFDKNLYDYLLLYLWDSKHLELAFITRVFPNLGRNDLGLSIMAINEGFNQAFPEDILKSNRLREFALKLRDRTITRPEFYNIGGEEFLLVGHKCIFMESIRLLAMYPVARIDEQVAAKKNLLLMLIFVSLLVSISLGLFVASGILKPLAELQTGVEALQTRDFAYRLPDLGGDEFGHLARIFNDMLVDLEEMHVAAIVQEKLMTQLSEPLQSGPLTAFGQTISLAGMGGDYFELLETSQKQPAFVLGDVSGRGVGTCLLLAFVKSALMQVEDKTGLPESLMKALHDLISRSSRAGENRSISLQYLLLSGDNRLEIINAGLPDPLLIDHNSGEVRFLSLPSRPLGCHNQAGLSQVKIEVASGHSLVCISGGVLRNGKIEQSKIVELLQKTKNENPQEFCRSFLQEYFKLTCRSECTDDVSLIIIHNSES